MERTSFKLFCLLCIILATFIFHIEAVNAANNKYQYRTLMGEQKFTEIKEQLVQSTHSLAQYKAVDAYLEIVNALNEFHQLRNTIKNSSNIDEVIEEVTDRFENISSTYERVAKLGSELINYRQGELRYLKGIGSETLRTQQEIERKIARLQSEDKLLRERLSSTMDIIERNNIKVSLKGNDSIINSLMAQADIWRKFYDAQNQLYDKLNLNGRNIDSLIHILEVNSKVYKEATNVIRLRKSARGALDNLSSLSDIQSIVFDLENSWTEVDDLISNISNAEFVISIN